MIAPLATPLVRSLALPLFRQGGGGDFPSLDLAFALDRSFTTDPAAAGAALITSRRGPAAKFSRGSAATQVNAAGLIEYAPENLIGWSNDAGNVSWLKTNLTYSAIVSTDLRFNRINQLVASIANGVHRISPPLLHLPAAIGQAQTVSFFIRKTFGGAYGFAFLNFGQAGIGANINLDTAAVIQTMGAVTATMTDDGWIRVVATGNVLFSDSTLNLQINRTNVVNDDLFVGDGISGFQIANFQLERASTARAYNPTTTAAFYGPRFDHDPATGASKGLLIEDTRTNLITNSGQANLWPVQNATITDVGRSIAPDASLNGFIVVLGLANINASGGILGAGTYTHSVFLKRVDSDWVRIQFNHAINTNIGNAYFNLATGQVGAVSVAAGSLTGLSADMKSYPNGWWRLQVTATVPATGSEQLSIISADSNSGARLAGATYEIWGGQIETGAFPLSYIPTTSGTVPRAADVCSIIGDAFSSFYNQSEGTMFASINEFRRGTTYSSYIAFRNNINTSSERITIGAYGTKTSVASPIEGFIAAGGIAGYTARPTAVQQPFNVSLGYASDNCRMALDGVLSVADAAPTVIPSTVNELSLSAAGGMGHHISRIQYFRKRLPDAKLQALTAP